MNKFASKIEDYFHNRQGFDPGLLWKFRVYYNSGDYGKKTSIYSQQCGLLSLQIEQLSKQRHPKQDN